MEFKVIKRNGNAIIRVIIEDGTYVIDDTIEFTAEDSATNGYRISYEAADGASPVISGGETITGWEYMMPQITSTRPMYRKA